VGEHFGVVHPVLVELRREFHEIAGDVKRKRRILHRCEHAVQRVPELVEQRADVVIADERGLARCGFGEVLNVVLDRQSAEQL
jgi:hypothetical protein